MLEGKRVIVTGGAGFLGRCVVARLEGANEVFVPRHGDYDLVDGEAAAQVFADFRGADLVIHAAADIGGIGYSSTHPATQFYNNTLINLHVVDEARKAGVGKLVAVGSVCEYPADTPVPFREESLWDGYPVVTNDSYGLTKRMLLAQCNAYRRQYGFRSIHLLPVNMYGPGDDFDPQNSHVIPALIRKVAEAMDRGEGSVDVWGTGLESREFVYVDDVAEAIVMAAEVYDKPEPVNLGSGEEISINQVAAMVKEILGYGGGFRYLDNGLGGQRRRMLDVSRAEREFGFTARTGFEEGLRATVRYYLDNRGTL